MTPRLADSGLQHDDAVEDTPYSFTRGWTEVVNALCF